MEFDESKACWVETPLFSNSLFFDASLRFADSAKTQNALEVNDLGWKMKTGGCNLRCRYARPSHLASLHLVKPRFPVHGRRFMAGQGGTPDFNAKKVVLSQRESSTIRITAKYFKDKTSSGAAIGPNSAAHHSG